MTSLGQSSREAGKCSFHFYLESRINSIVLLHCLHFYKWENKVLTLVTFRQWKIKQIQASYPRTLTESTIYLIFGCSSTRDLVQELTCLKRDLNLVQVNFSTTIVTNTGSFQSSSFKIFFFSTCFSSCTWPFRRYPSGYKYCLVSLHLLYFYGFSMAT